MMKQIHCCAVTQKMWANPFPNSRWAEYDSEIHAQLMYIKKSDP